MKDCPQIANIKPNQNLCRDKTSSIKLLYFRHRYKYWQYYRNEKSSEFILQTTKLNYISPLSTFKKRKLNLFIHFISISLTDNTMNVQVGNVQEKMITFYVWRFMQCTCITNQQPPSTFTVTQHKCNFTFQKMKYQITKSSLEKKELKS